MTNVALFILSVIIALVLFYGAFFVWGAIIGFRDWRRNTQSIDRVIPFSLFLEAYNKAPDRWICLPYHVRYGKDDVRFENYADYRKYEKWREKRKRDEETERKREANEALYREIRKDLVPTKPTTGSCAINRKSETAGKEYIYDDLASDLKNGRYMILYGEHTTVITESGFAIRNYKLPSDVADEIEAQGKRYKLHRKEFACLSYDCIYRIIDNTPPPTVYKPTNVETVREEIHRLSVETGPKICGACGKCRQFDKGDNSPFGYCFRNDEIVNEASMIGCFEPKSKAEERPEPLGTVTTH